MTQHHFCTTNTSRTCGRPSLFLLLPVFLIVSGATVPANAQAPSGAKGTATPFRNSVTTTVRTTTTKTTLLQVGMVKPATSRTLGKPSAKPGAAKKAPPKTVPVKPQLLNAAWQAAAIEIVAAGRGRINYEAGVVKATGLGAMRPPSIKNSRAQDILDARDAAFNDAIRSLSIALSEVRVTADTKVYNYVLKDDNVRLRLDSILRNPEVIEEKILPRSGVYRIVVQARLNGKNSLLEALDAKKPVNRPTPTPTPSPFAPGSPAPGNARYTSLLVDCRGFRVRACMSPKIYDQHGNEVYGTMKISPDYVIETGIAAYPRSVQDARNCTRAGDRPLVVKAVGVADDNRFYVVISRNDAEKVLQANQDSRFFERTAVVLLIDPDRS